MQFQRAQPSDGSPWASQKRESRFPASGFAAANYGRASGDISGSVIVKTVPVPGVLLQAILP